jgi:hypothetical protein
MFTQSGNTKRVFKVIHCQDIYSSRTLYRRIHKDIIVLKENYCRYNSALSTYEFSGKSTCLLSAGSLALQPELL